MTDGRRDGPLIRLEDVRRYFPVRTALPRLGRRTYVRAVDGISFDVEPRETLSVVGESGCGKTTTARLILKLDQPTAGRILFEDRDVTRLGGGELRRYRASVQAVFQDPTSSLNPRMRAGDIVAEPLVVNAKLARAELRERVRDLFVAVGLEPAAVRSFPHEFSGGMRQRIAVARALALHPSLIVLDEPVSALDVSIRAQIMNLLKDLQATLGMAYLLIAHNLATVRYLSHRVVVMYLGKIVERAEAEALFTLPMHPYTRALISASVPARPGERREEVILAGDLPSPTSPPRGCRFHSRCPVAVAACSEAEPELRELAPAHHVACHLA
jgi:oligopeptide/dipeptide ABC transporter ATP-binding protein